MKKTLILTTALCASFAAVHAADEPKTTKPKRDPAVTFKLMDTDGDGSVNLAEYTAGMTGKMNPARIEGVFKQKDKDGDGKLNLEEMKFIPPPATPVPPVKPEKKDEPKPAPKAE
jgi:hypothetical protein